jgi:hypothetical protein
MKGTGTSLVRRRAAVKNNLAMALSFSCNLAWLKPEGAWMWIKLKSAFSATTMTLRAKLTSLWVSDGGADQHHEKLLSGRYCRPEA